jgi:hypothetical protein
VSKQRARRRQICRLRRVDVGAVGRPLGGRSRIVTNIQVTHDTSPNNARSESSLVIDPNNSARVVAASKKFVDIHNYDFTLATSFSTDGGHSWNDSAALAMSDNRRSLTRTDLA